MTANPHKDFYKGRLYFDAIFQSMLKGKQEVSKSDILRNIGLKFPISISTFEQYIKQFYIQPGLIVEKDGFYIPNIERKEVASLTEASADFDATLKNLGVDL